MTVRKQRDPATTSRIMAAIRCRDSKAELALRRELHRRGFRYRLHVRDVEGKPDLAVKSRKIAVFVDGDFFHGNGWRLRGLARLEDQFPTNTEFWVRKITRNIERDREVTLRLEAAGWRVVRIWESDVLADPAGAALRVLTAIGETRHPQPSAPRSVRAPQQGRAAS